MFHNTKSTVLRFLSMYGGYTGRRLSYSTAATTYATPFVLGTTQAGLDAGSLENTKLIILWGSNVVDNRFDPELEQWIREAKARGVKVIVIEPRRTRTVKTLGDEWVKIYPGTDSAFMLAILYELMRARAFGDPLGVDTDKLRVLCSMWRLTLPGCSTHQG